MAERDRYQAGVTTFAQRGYGNPDDRRLDSDVLVDAIETAAAVAGESSTAIGSVLWTDRPIS
jgi:ribulose-bisphosphate carboxylase large chain